MLYKLFVCLLLNFLTSCLLYLLRYSFTSLLAYFFQNKPVLFPGFSCLCSFRVVVYFVMDACLRLLCLIYFFSTEPRDWLRRMSPI